MLDRRIGQELGNVLRHTGTARLRRLRDASARDDERGLMLEATRSVREVLEAQGLAPIEAVDRLGGELFLRLRWLAGAPLGELDDASFIAAIASAKPWRVLRTTPGQRLSSPP